MSAVVIVGAQWGDEGKGKIVDLATEHADVVVRYAGGPNAGHTLVVGEEKVVVRLIPSGILQPHAQCLMGQGMVVDLAVLLSEIEALEKRKIAVRDRLFVSELAHVIVPYHVLVDGLRESAAEKKKIGTTRKGIGPAYEDKVARRGLRVGDLRNETRVRELLDAALAAWEPVVTALGGKLPPTEAVLDEVMPLARKLQFLFTDTGKLLDDAVKKDKRVLLEGAQGTLLDVDAGTYPFVTSSSAVAGGACTGSGIGPSRIDRTIGITKAYATRVGEGPFPSELHDATGERIRQRGGEFGSVTGRPRRTGWIDLPALRYAARVNGVDGWAITKLDVLTGLKEIRACVAYAPKAASGTEGRTDDLPLAALASYEPVFESFEGWDESIEDARSLDQLPAAAAALVRAIEDRTGIGADIVSVGPRRDQTIVVRDVFR